MRKLFLLAGLCAMIISACSTDESDVTEQRQAQIREQIVGVWRNGDYFISFSDDGVIYHDGDPIHFRTESYPEYYNGYCNSYYVAKDKECINSGIYTIKNNTIYLFHEIRHTDTLQYHIKSISETNLELLLDYKDRQDILSFVKSEESVFGKQYGLTGITFEYTSKINGQAVQFRDSIASRYSLEHRTESLPPYTYLHYIYQEPYLYTADEWMWGAVQVHIGKLYKSAQGTYCYEAVR